MDNKLNDLLELSKKTALIALSELIELDGEGRQRYSFDNCIPREMKAEVDTVIEKIIIEQLIPVGFDLLSEESGVLIGDKDSSLRFIIDPIDGTVNFIRGIAPCSISIALYDANEPLFGVIASYPNGNLAWGGKNIGSFIGDLQLQVSSIENPAKGVLCTGFPSRFNFDSESISEQIKLMSRFGKTRMLGSASQSLLQVARGSVEYYSEKDIMLWDVAAGIAIVEGAGGKVVVTEREVNYLLNVIAYNSVIDLK